MTVKDIFENQIAKRAPEATDIDAVFFFNVTGEQAGQWVVDLTDGGKVYEGTTDKADCSITIADSDFMDLVSGKVPGAMLFMQQKLAITGNMGLAMKLGQLVGGS